MAMDVDFQHPPKQLKRSKFDANRIKTRKSIMYNKTARNRYSKRKNALWLIFKTSETKKYLTSRPQRAAALKKGWHSHFRAMCKRQKYEPGRPVRGPKFF